MHLSNPFRNRIRLATLLLLPPLLVAVLLVATFGAFQYGTTADALVERGLAEARQLAAAADVPLRSGDRQQLNHLVQDTTRADDDIAAATILDTRRLPLAGSGHSVLVRVPALRDEEHSFVANDVLVIVVPVRSRLSSDDELAAPAAGAAVAGTVVLEISRRRLLREQLRLLGFGGAATILGLLLGALVATRLARGVTRPVQHMSEVVRRIASGDLAARVRADADGVFRQLEDDINEMAQRMATNREQLNARVVAATAELRGRKEEAERAATAKSRFLAAASHDLRQPMHALGLFVSRLGSLPLSHEAHGVVRHIEDSVAALDTLFDSMLDVSRIDAGLVVPNPRPVAVAEIFDRVDSELAESARSQGLAFRRRVAPGLRLHGDPALIERILVNLVGNAIRYTRRGGLLLTARPRGGKIRLAVWDTGIGIPAESQQIIFDEYVQLGNPERDRAKGLGLGLSICHRLARLLGTRLYLRSVPGRGSVFWFDLPPESAAPATPAVDARAAGGRGDESVAGRLAGTVAIVDDDELVLTSTADLLASWGCRVVAGSSVADVLLQCGTSAQPPDAAIVDYRLRGFENGLNSARALRDRFGAIPVMMLTGDMSEQFRLDAARQGFQVMAKPLKPARLRAMLQHMLERTPS